MQPSELFFLREQVKGINGVFKATPSARKSHLFATKFTALNTGRYYLKFITVSWNCDVSSSKWTIHSKLLCNRNLVMHQSLLNQRV